MLQELDGKIAVITGGGSGIGASLARACAAEGMRVVVVDVSGERAASVAAELPDGTAVARAVDVSDAASVEALADFAFDTFGAVHLLCNNAGVSPAGRIWDFTDDEWRWLLGVNVHGVANGIRSFVPRMIEQGEGHIVNTGSGASFVSTPRLGPYCATKHAIVGLSEALRYELDGTGIGVSVLVPAGVNTNIGDSMVRPSATDPDAIADDFTVLTNAMDETSLAVIEPEVVAEVTLVGVREGWPYIVMGPGQSVGVERRYGEVLDAHRLSKERFPFLP
ncbi:MAG TPA: SDR family NAD(P)-dependent oxidoreductase [Acidimicrobiia bacterium]|jgi:NAD(P)-dependent dehydrogenase (short-subunit alcohol dehydrogenase family)|nr:SDR family NAD(P)-dependent oxidoreductase [Acidimicrobiia bacterium]